MSFAISSWSEIAYHDPSLVQYNFKIAEDLIYDVTNDTFAGGVTCMLMMFAVLVDSPCQQERHIQQCKRQMHAARSDAQGCGMMACLGFSAAVHACFFLQLEWIRKDSYA